MKKLVIGAVLLGSALCAQAAVIPAQSKLDFKFSQMGVAADGGFGRFATVLNFDPKAPQNGDVSVTIDLSSVNGGSSDASTELKKPAWFDVRRFATATFTAKGFTATGPNSYLAKGELLLKGKKVAVNLPFKTSPAPGGQLWIEGNGEVKRLNFDIGSGEWEDTGIVADEVKIHFKLLYKP